MRVIDQIASICSDLQRCNASEMRTHLQRLADIEANLLPHGGGIDADVYVDSEISNDGCVVIVLSYHVMNDVGFYTHWRDYTVIVTPTFQDIHVHVDVTGAEDDESALLDYISDVFYEHLVRGIPGTEDAQRLSADAQDLLARAQLGSDE